MAKVVSRRSPPQMGQRAAGPTQANPRANARSSPLWDILIGLKSAGTTDKPARAQAMTIRRNPRWLWPSVAAGVLLLGLIVAWALILRVKTSIDTIEMLNLPKDAEVFVDGESVEVRWPAGGKPAVITVIGGEHKVMVKKDGIEISGGEVTVHSGAIESFTVKLTQNSELIADKEIASHRRDFSPDESDSPMHSKPVPMNFNEDTPLEHVIKYVKEATKVSIKSGLPIYVDPIGLQEAEKSMTSTITNINLDGLPLSTTLPRATCLWIWATTSRMTS